MDFYAYWGLAGRIASLHSKLVVFVTNLRAFIPAGGVRGLTDFTAEIDLTDVPETLTYIRGMTAPRVLLALRKNVQDAATWEVLGPVERPPTQSERFVRFMRAGDRILHAYDRPLGPDNPIVAFMRATVSKLSRAGITVLVVVTPMPLERAAEAGYYEPGRYARRVAVLHGAVEASGGHFLDLHHALAKNMFRDADRHFTAEMARLLAPVVVGLLRPGPARVAVLQ